jgi:hypothetical protein
MRKLVLVLMALLLVVGTAQGADAKGKRKYRVTISAPSSIMIGQSVSITGRITPAAAGHRVSLQKRIPGKGGYRTEARSRVRADGTYAFTDKPKSRHTRFYRVQIGKSKKVRAGTSRAKKVRVTKKRVISPQLSITGVSSRTLDAGQSVTVTGMGSANARGLRVYLEAGAAGSWGSIASGYVKRDRTISLSGPITSAGAAVPLRLRIAGSKWITETASAATSVTVYGWYYLSDLDRVDSSSWGDEGSYNINGVTYDKTVKSLTYTEAGWAEWDLARKCRTLETTVGLLDTADSDAIRHGRISVDTVDKWAVTNIKLGQSYPVSIGINGALRVRLASTGGENDGALGFGNARILCAL